MYVKGPFISAIPLKQIKLFAFCYAKQRSKISAEMKLVWSCDIYISRFLFPLEYIVIFIYALLQFVWNQCTLYISVISVKTEVHPEIFSDKKLFKNATLQILNFIPIS